MSGKAEVDGPLLLPTESEIYLLPDGRVVVADLPEPLLGLVTALGVIEPCEIRSASASASGPAIESGCSPERDYTTLPLD